MSVQEIHFVALSFQVRSHPEKSWIGETEKPEGSLASQQIRVLGKYKTFFGDFKSNAHVSNSFILAERVVGELQFHRSYFGLMKLKEPMQDHICRSSSTFVLRSFMLLKATFTCNCQIYEHLL